MNIRTKWVCSYLFISLDINECDVLNGGCSHFCTNTNGHYYCSCPMGYELDNKLLCEGK